MIRYVSSVEKLLSIGALSQTLPKRLMGHRVPLSPGAASSRALELLGRLWVTSVD